MLCSRNMFSSLRHGGQQTKNLLKRYGSAKRIQSFSYSRSSGQGGKPIVSVGKEESRSSATPGALLGFAGIVAFVHYNDERRVIPKGQGGHQPRSDNVAGPIIGGPFTLIDMEGNIVDEKSFLGKWVLLYFGYTFSPDVGPEEVQIMANAVDRLESKQGLNVLPVFVSMDPQRDTPSHLRAYLNEFDPRIMGLTGAVGAIRQMAQEYRVYFRKIEDEGEDYLIDSSHNMYLLNPKMEVVRCFGVEYNSEELAQVISKEVKRTDSS